MLSLQGKIEIVLICGEHKPHKEVVTIFNTRHPEKSIAQSTVTRLMKKFKQTGSVSHIFKKSHTKWVTADEQSCENVVLDIVENKITSISEVANRTDISRSSVYRILRNDKYRQYKPKFFNPLKQRDFDSRFYFSIWYQGMIEEKYSFWKNILWTDEATFSSNGTASSQNCRWWSVTNPKFVIECKDQYSFKVNIWCGLIGPFFFDDNLTAQTYTEFLRTTIAEIVDDMPFTTRLKVWH